MSKLGSRRPRHLGERSIEVALRSEAEMGTGIYADTADDGLSWVDAAKGEIHRLDPRSRADVVAVRTDAPLSFAIPRRAGGWMSGRADGVGVLDDHGRIDKLVRLDGAIDTDRISHATCDTEGRLWVCTSGRAGSADGSAAGSRADAAIHRIDAELAASRVFDGLTRCNGLAFTADGGRLFHADGGSQTITSHRVDRNTGELDDPIVFADLSRVSGTPHGIALDIAGCVWVALYDRGEVHRYTAVGRLDTVIDLPVTRPTGVAFGGTDASTVFITTAWQGLDMKQRRRQLLAGAVFAVDVGIAGVATRPFG